MLKNRAVLLINSILVLAILVFLFLNYYKKNVIFNCNYNSEPNELFELINREFPDSPRREYSLLFVFNEIPAQSDLENIGKIDRKFKKDINVLTLFSKKFKSDEKMAFPFKYLSRLNLTCQKNGSKIKHNFFIFLSKEKLKYVGVDIKMPDINYLIQRYLYPGSDYQDYAVSVAELKSKVMARIKKGHIGLFNLMARRAETISDFSKFSKIYFVHAACSSCQLQSILSRIKLNRIISSEENIVVFSVLANSFELFEMVRNSGEDLKIYLDINDEFNLFFNISDDKENPVEIDLKDITGEI